MAVIRVKVTLTASDMALPMASVAIRYRVCEPLSASVAPAISSNRLRLSVNEPSVPRSASRLT